MFDVLCDEFGLIGIKEGCFIGDCGVCSVIVDGDVVCLCLMFGVEVEGWKVEIIEGFVVFDNLYFV